MHKALLAPLFLSAFITGCATPVSNKTVLDSKEAVLMICKSGAPFILTQQIQSSSKESVIVKTLPVSNSEECALIVAYNTEILLTKITSNRSNKDRPRVDVYKVPLLPGNLIKNERVGYKASMSPNSVNYIGHVSLDSYDGTYAGVTFSDNSDSAKAFLKKKGITKFPFVKNIPVENIQSN
jgi:hypothetical protein